MKYREHPHHSPHRGRQHHGEHTHGIEQSRRGGHHPHGHHEHGHHPQGAEGGHGFFHGRPGRHGRHGDGEHHGEMRGRARRGEARFILLDALREAPKHGYEIIRALEERSGGQYIPSAGTVYPTLQLLEDQGFIQAEQGTERRVYTITDAGRAELETHAREIADFWERFAISIAVPVSQTETGFLQDELEHLSRTIWGGLQNVPDRDNQERIRRIRQVVERCQTEIRDIFADSGEKA